MSDRRNASADATATASADADAVAYAGATAPANAVDPAPDSRNADADANSVATDMSLEDVVYEAVPPTKRLRYQHHHMAQLIVEGRSTSEVALLTGYSISYISTTRHHDPAFRLLLEHYAAQRTAVFVDSQARLRDLGLLAAEILQERLTESPTTFTPSELLSIATLGVKQEQKPAPAPVSVSFRFIAPQVSEQSPETQPHPATLIDVTPEQPP